MKVKWLLEPDVFEDNTDKLIEEIKKQGMEVNVIPYIPFDDDLAERCLKIYNADECVVFYGSLNFGRKLRKLPWIPGVYLNEKAFECTSYYPAIGRLLLHHENYWMMPYGDLINHKTRIFDAFGNKIFLRPNSGMKEFTGMVCWESDFYDCIKLAGFYGVDPNMLVLISRVDPLEKEWRFVIVDGEPVAGSLYRDWSSPEKIAPGTVTKDYVLLNSHSVWEKSDDKSALMTAVEAAKRYNPDRCWTIDIVKTEYRTYHVLEIGCFSCAGLYGCDLEKVVKTVSKAAEAEWNEYFNG